MWPLFAVRVLCHGRPTARPSVARMSFPPVPCRADGSVCAGDDFLRVLARVGVTVRGEGREALAGKGPQTRPQKRLSRRLEASSKAVEGSYRRLPMPLKLALAVRETVCWLC